MQLLKAISRNFCFKFVLFFCNPFFHFACETASRSSIQDFENVQVYFLGSTKRVYSRIYTPWDISSLNNYLVIAESPRNSPEYPLIHLFEKKSLNYAFSKGRMGFGPFEIASAHGIEPGFTDDTFQVYCPINKKFVTFSLSDTSQLGISEYKQPDELFGMYTMYHVTDSTVLGMMADDSNRLVEYSSITGKRINGFGNWEKIQGIDHLIDYEDPDINYHMGEINKGRLRVNRELGLFVKAMAFRDRIEIFHYPTQTFRVVDGPRKEVHPFEIKRSKGRSAVIFDLSVPFGFGDAEVGNQFIYALYCGLTNSEMINSDQIARTVYVFSHQGELVCKFDLDRSVRSIAVDENLGQLYGITTDRDPGIAVFQLPIELFD